MNKVSKDALFLGAIHAVLARDNGSSTATSVVLQALDIVQQVRHPEIKPDTLPGEGRML